MEEFFPEVYRCWPQGFTLQDSKLVEAINPKEAAKIAVEGWRLEGLMDFRQVDVVINVNDSNNQIHKVYVNQEMFMDSSGPDA